VRRTLRSGDRPWRHASELSSPTPVLFRQDKNEPDIRAAFKAHASEAEGITKDHPELHVYANVELVIMETWKTKVSPAWDTEPYDRKLSDITFKALAVSIYRSSKKKILWDRQSSFSQAVADGFTEHVRYTLMTYPVEITFGETPQQRQQRTFAHRIVNAVKKRQSARIVAGSHLGAAPSARPQKGGSLRSPGRAIWRRASNMCVNISSTPCCTVRTTSIWTRSRISRSWKRSGSLERAAREQTNAREPRLQFAERPREARSHQIPKVDVDRACANLRARAA